jgi:hypothetical protein
MVSCVKTLPSQMGAPPALFPVQGRNTKRSETSFGIATWLTGVCSAAATSHEMGYGEPFNCT